ncbi:hypothetical protein TNCT_147241 [Trichonephila clavata]|uniref:Uncharacterized protein n=1 Tax=Trichonephila clavata TaxID=2740835 RepID=A0A8X6KIN0_TRICU|nr:hypothetical protein TNCT_147241 [Trichonephila clavata]
MLIDAKSDSWKKFLLTIDAPNVWKKAYTYGVKREFMNKIEITGIELPTREKNTSLDETKVLLTCDYFPTRTGNLNLASEWSKCFKLDFNPDKTIVTRMAIEKRNVYCDAFQQYLDGTPLTTGKQMKYFGFLIYTKFSWKQHLSNISEKCDKLQRELNPISYVTPNCSLSSQDSTNNLP